VPHDAVGRLALALTIAALAALFSSRLRFSIIPFLIFLGMIVGPQGPVISGVDLRLLTTGPVIELLARLGALFLFFVLGLEFSVGSLARSLHTIAAGGGLYVALNFGLGLGYGRLAWGEWQTALVVSGIMGISSSAIVAKTLVDLRRTANPETEVILGVLLVEDIVIAIYLSVLAGVILSRDASGPDIAWDTARSLAFIVLFVVIGRQAIRLLGRGLSRLSQEALLISVVAALLLAAAASATVDVAETIAALLVGLVLAGTGRSRELAALIVPLRYLFGAIFFLAFGARIDPLALGRVWPLAGGAIGLTIAANITAGNVAGRLAGLGPAASANVGFSIIARGEFSVIVAALAARAGVDGSLQPFSALYVLALSFVGPLFMKESRRLYRLLARFRPFARRRDGAG